MRISNPLPRLREKTPIKKARITAGLFRGYSLWVLILCYRLVLLREVFRFGVAFGAAFVFMAAFFSDSDTALERTELSDRRNFLAMSPVGVLLYDFLRNVTSSDDHCLAPDRRLTTVLRADFFTARFGAALLILLRGAFLLAGFFAGDFFLEAVFRLIVLLTKKPSYASITACLGNCNHG